MSLPALPPFRLLGLLVVSLLSFPAAESWAIISLHDNVELEGFVQSQFVLRTPQYQGAQLVVQRNTLQLENTWNFIQDGQTTLGNLSTGLIEEATFKLIYRFAYDSTYDLSDSRRDNFSQGRRDHLKYENWIREAYLDLALPPITLRIGRQQVIWGETDTFRALDVINPLDTSWHWAREPWEDLRFPLFMTRAVYDIGKFGPFEESFVEGIWIPGDFKRSRGCGNPDRPWCYYGSRRRGPVNTALVGGEVVDFVTEVRDKKPDWQLKNSELGFRFKAVYGLVDFGLHYFWTLSDTTGVKVRTDRLGPITDNTLTVPIDLVNPRSHVVGVSANYSEETYTQAVYRVEAAYTTGIPMRLGTRDPRGVPRRLDEDNNAYQTTEQSLLMVAFDRPTWIRPLNGLRTFFITGQFFWEHFTDYNRFFRGVPSRHRAIDPRSGEPLPDRYLSVNTDRIFQDRVVATLSASSSYGPGGLIQPLFAVAYNPLWTTFFNRLSVKYLYSNHLVFQLTHDIYWGKSTEESWFIGGRFGGGRNNRNETVFTAIFQF
ncbi:MAG: hypothetical protein E8D45_06815 [Nitrospira sp.]|nr:MAG: hypothetical protein E8D45_06815 [Nitrospira sp.]